LRISSCLQMLAYFLAVPPKFKTFFAWPTPFLHFWPRDRWSCDFEHVGGWRVPNKPKWWRHLRGMSAVVNYSPFAACGIRSNFLDPIEGLIGGGLCRHMVLTHGNWEWHRGSYRACMNKIQHQKMHSLKCSNLINYNYILCKLKIGPWNFNYDTGLRWTSKVFKMKSYGHSQSCSGWLKHWVWEFIVPLGTTWTITRVLCLCF
jgi:hypothetical protein